MMPLGRRSKCSLTSAAIFSSGNHTRAFGVDRDVHGLGHANGVGHLHLALARQTGGHHVLGHIAGGIGSRAVYLAGVFAAEGTAAVGAGAAVGVHDDLATGQAAIALRATDDKSAGGVDQVAGVLQPFFGQNRLDQLFDDGFVERGLHLQSRFRDWSGVCWVDSTTVSMLWGLPST